MIRITAMMYNMFPHDLFFYFYVFHDVLIFHQAFIDHTHFINASSVDYSYPLFITVEIILNRPFGLIKFDV
jgi:hypothetical protein